ncbi:MAG: hypothetical protein Q7I99_03060 [Acholeplasmataceae bacterium]|nr:hypothetical protein [Acholeplasmataceae bacterium]
MRKIFYVIMLFGLFFIQACKGEETVPIEIVCGTNEENVDGVCQIIYLPEELALMNAIKNIETMKNYQLDITIQNGFELYDVVIQFDDEKSSFEFDGQKDYYELSSGTLYHYVPQGSIYAKQTLTQSQNSEYDFFKAFEIEWFTYNNGKYLMNLQNQGDAQIFFESSFPDSELSGFEMTIVDNHISEMIFFLLAGEINYRFIIEFNNIGTTNIVLPTV